MGDGPDRIVPTEDIRTWRQDGAVKVRKSGDWPANMESQSLVTVFDKTCATAGNGLTVFKYKMDGKWISVSYADYHKQVNTVARAFIKLGLEQHKAVAMFGMNAPEWFLSDIGCIYAGGMAVGLYPTNSAEVNKFILIDCSANILVCEDAKMAQSIWDIKNELPNLKKIVVYTGQAPDLQDVISWKELIEIGESDKDETELKERHKNMAINQCATLVYTSGTTGNPKGVMLSHDNIYWTTMVCMDYLQLKEGSEVMISYLPLSHMAANLVDIWAMFMIKGTMIFADKMALKGTLLATMVEARPTVFFGVPRVWEKIQEGMMDKGRQTKGLKKAVAQACKKAGLKHHLEGKDGFFYNLGKKAVYTKVREALGLDRCHSFYSGAAPIAQETLKYFLSLDIVVNELYGMSETNGPHTLCVGNIVKLGSVGKTLPGCKTKLDNKDADGNGEVCMWGRNIMMGYLNREDKTMEDMDGEGWLKSGDVGSMDAEGYLYITGRIKELLITAGGENVAPVIVEDTIKKELPIVSNAVLIGDKKKFLTVFLTFKVEMDKNNGSPTNQLTPGAIAWCKSVGSNATTVTDVLQGPDGRIMNAIQQGIDRVNKVAISRAAVVQKWTILPLDVSVPGGELGPTLKLKRFFFNKKFSEAIERLYV